MKACLQVDFHLISFVLTLSLPFFSLAMSSKTFDIIQIQYTMASIASQIQQQQLYKQVNKSRQKFQIPQEQQFDKAKVLQTIKLASQIPLQVNKQMSNLLANRHPLTFAQRQVLDQLTPVKQVYYDYFQDQDQLTLKKVLSYSCFPLMVSSLLKYIGNLIDIQIQVDPVTLELIKVPTGMPVIQFVTEVIKMNDIQAMLGQIIRAFQPTQHYKQIKNDILRPILQLQMSVMKHFNFSLQPETFQAMFFNQRTLKITDENKIKQIQTKALQKKLLVLNSMKMPRGQEFVINHLRKVILRKRKQYQMETEHTFISDFEQVSQTQLNSIQDKIKNHLIQQSKTIYDSVRKII